MTDTTRLLLLGPLSIERDGRPVNGFESRKALALLCYLILTEKAVARGYLVELFWGDKSEKRGRNNLSRVLSNISSRLPGSLETTRHSVRFVRTSQYWIDSDAFVMLEKQNDQASLPGAAKLIRGELLEDLVVDDCPEFDLWLLAKREAWRQRITDILRRLIDYYTEQGNYRLGLACATQLLDLEPWREEAHRIRMQLLAQSGQRTAALAQYEICRRVLAQELGVRPSPETRALYEEIQGGSYQRRHAALSTVLHLPESPTPFIGRESELSILLNRIASPGYRLLTLTGLGGVGKTRLALQALAEYRQHVDRQVLFITADSDKDDSPYARVLRAAGQSPQGSREGDLNRLSALLRDRQVIIFLDDFGSQPTDLQVVEELIHLPGRHQVLLTSRTRLLVRGEWVLDVKGMAYPDSVQEPDFDQCDAVYLFTQACQRMKADFIVTPADRALVLTICENLQGHPLALELAAEWIRVQTLAEIASATATDLAFLTSQMLDVPAKHRSMEVILSTAWQSLTATQRQVLRDLASYRASSSSQHTPQAPLAVIASLVDRSLAARTPTGQYTVHPLVRLYALAQPDENDVLRSAMTKLPTEIA